MLLTTYVVHYPNLSYISGQELVSKNDFLHLQSTTITYPTKLD